MSDEGAPRPNRQRPIQRFGAAFLDNSLADPVLGTDRPGA